MSRITLIWNGEEWVERARYQRPTKGHVAVISDHLDAMVSMADGQTYTSKRAYQKSVRAAGCEIVGNERIDHIRRPELHGHHEIAHDIKRSIEELRSGKHAR